MIRRNIKVEITDPRIPYSGTIMTDAANVVKDIPIFTARAVAVALRKPRRQGRRDALGHLRYPRNGGDHQNGQDCRGETLYTGNTREILPSAPVRSPLLQAAGRGKHARREQKTATQVVAAGDPVTAKRSRWRAPGARTCSAPRRTSGTIPTGYNSSASVAAGICFIAVTNRRMC
jgi:hypothetical protein